MAQIVTANVLVTDTVGSTSVLVRSGANAAEVQRHLHDRIVGNVIDVFGGDVVKSTGDGVLALVPSADLLVRAAVAIQEASAAADLALRVGGATGDVVREERDCFGEAVVLASRLCDACPRGEVLVDATTAAVRGRRRDPELVPSEPLRLRGFDDPVIAWTAAPRTLRTDDGGDGTALVGRVAELDAVLAALGDPIEAARRVVVISGEPGIGKTTLARAAARRAASHGGPPLVVRFLPDGADGLAPWCQALGESIGRDVAPGVVAALGRKVLDPLARMLPGLGAHFGVDLGTASETDPHGVLDALVALTGAVTSGRTIVLDDVQWAGASAEAFVRRVVDDTAGGRIVATSRLPVSPAMASVATAVVHLTGLDDDELDELLRARGLDAAAVSEAVERSNGNPFLALVAAGVAGGTARDPVGELFLSLPTDVVDVLAVAGLVGRRIDAPMLRDVCGATADALTRCLAVAVDAGVLEGDETLSFVHDIVREAAAATIPGHRRAELHARLSGVLARRDDAVGAMRHVLDGFAAMDPDDAVAMSVAGIEQLLARAAPEDALVAAERLIARTTADERCRPRHTARAMLLAGWANQSLGRVEVSKEIALQAAALAFEDTDDEVVTLAALARVGYGMAGLPDEASASLIDRALGRVAPDADSLRARLLAMRAFYLVNYEGRGAEARAASAEGLRLARRSRDLRALVDSLTQRLFVLMAGPDVAEQELLVEELRTMATAPSIRWFRVAVMIARFEGPLALQLGDRRRFEAARREVDRLREGRHDWMLNLYDTMWTGAARLLDGDPDGAERAGLSLLQASGRDPNFVASAAGLLTGANRWRGTLGAIARETAHFADGRPGLPLAAALAMIAQAVAGDRDDAARRWRAMVEREPIVLDDSTVGAQLASVVEAAALLGEAVPPSVRASLGRFSGKLIVVSWGVDVLGSADRFLAVAHALDGDRASAVVGFERAVALEGRISEPLVLRTLVWRHHLLGDVPVPDIPDGLSGLRDEGAALRAALG